MSAELKSDVRMQDILSEEDWPDDGTLEEWNSCARVGLVGADRSTDEGCGSMSVILNQKALKVFPEELLVAAEDFPTFASSNTGSETDRNLREEKWFEKMAESSDSFLAAAYSQNPQITYHFTRPEGAQNILSKDSSTIARGPSILSAHTDMKRLDSSSAATAGHSTKRARG